MREWLKQLSEIDKDCVYRYEYLLGRKLNDYEEYSKIDKQVDEMILEWESRSAFFAAYPDLKKYSKQPESKVAPSHLNAKRDRFIRIAEVRVQKVLDDLKALSRCSAKESYEYTQEDVEKIFAAIDQEVQAVRERFAGIKKFSLASDAETPALKPSLNEIIQGAKTQKEHVLALFSNPDRTWCAKFVPVKDLGDAAPLTKEQSYPVDVYFSRTDLNGSSCMERETCANREELLQLMNWLGKCCLTPAECWDYDWDREISPALEEIFSKASDRRAEMVQSEIAFALEEMSDFSASKSNQSYKSENNKTDRNIER